MKILPLSFLGESLWQSESQSTFDPLACPVAVPWASEGSMLLAALAISQISEAQKKEYGWNQKNKAA